MKKISSMLLLVFFIGVPSPPVSAYNRFEWLTNLTKAQERASEEDKEIFVYFCGSDWCKWCEKFKREALQNDDFYGFVRNNFVLLLIDFPKNSWCSKNDQHRNMIVALRYNVTSIPTVLILNSDGKEIRRFVYRRGGAKAYLKDILPDKYRYRPNKKMVGHEL